MHEELCILGYYLEVFFFFMFPQGTEIKGNFSSALLTIDDEKTVEDVDKLYQ